MVGPLEDLRGFLKSLIEDTTGSDFRTFFIDYSSSDVQYFVIIFKEILV